MQGEQQSLRRGGDQNGGFNRGCNRLCQALPRYAPDYWHRGRVSRVSLQRAFLIP